MNRKKTAKKAAIRKKTTVKTRKQLADNVPATFPVVGIGASAGGIEAMSQLLTHLQPNLGMAYVIVQHLSPTHESILPELLQRKSTMSVHKVKDGIKMQPNNIYVIPPDTFMSVADGHLVLSERQTGERKYHLIDYFLSSLASIYQNNAIAIILSGVGSDGTEGIQAIKAAGGITFAQDDSALFQAMARHAYESGYIDFILSPESIAKELAALALQEYAITPPDQSLIISEWAIKKIFALLYSKFGVDFSQYKQSTINRRITRRIALNRLKNLEEYNVLLRDNEVETELLYRDLLINVTNFFREPALFALLAKKVFPDIVKKRKADEAIRIWIPACASGEEACSMAICLFEYLGEKAVTTPIQIFATDLSDAAIDKARSGLYGPGSLQHVSPKRLKQFFVRVDGNYQIIKPIRDICIFAKHNLLKDPPFSRMDLISCQNVMIYLSPGAQKKIFQAFHYALKPESWLVLGKSESTGNDPDLFEIFDKENKIYTRRTSSRHTKFNYFSPASPAVIQYMHQQKPGITHSADIDIEKEADKLLLARYVPAAVVVNKDLQILRFHGPINNYLQPASGKASLHLLKMVRDEVVFELRRLLSRAKKEARMVIKENVPVTDAGQTREINIEITPVKSNSPAETCFLIVFNERVSAGNPGKTILPAEKRSRQDSKDRRIHILEQEKREAQEQIKSMSEEFEATREELQSANEEVLSSNEELQSINEELETSKEEMQSTNEELITINDELQLRNTDLKESVDYAEAIVETIREPLVVLHTDLRIRTANRSFYTLFSLDDDIEGHYFYDIASGLLDVPELRKQLQKTITKGIGFQDFELRHHFKGLGEKILLFNATRINGEDKKRTRVLLAIEDMTERALAEERVRVAMQAGKMGTWDWNMEKDEIYLSQQYKQMFGIPAAQQLINYEAIFAHIHPDDRQAITTQVKEAVAERKDVVGELRAGLNGDSFNWIAFFGRTFYKPDGKAYRMIGVVMNITDRKALEKQKEEFIGIASHELKTPVSRIKSYTQLLLDILTEKGDNDSVVLAEKLHKQIDRLALLVSDLLDVTRINEGRFQLHKEPTDLHALIREIAEQVQQTTQTHTIICELKPVPLVLCDEERTRQVLVNILSNAIKYSPGVNKVVIAAGSDGREVTVSVRDFGIGMTESTRLHVFERFFRANDLAISTYPGLGLGLYIAADIVRRQGGRIWVDSSPGEGACFYFTLAVH